jgi:hypothetical protein
MRIARIIALTLLLAVTVASTSSFASPLQAQSTRPAAVWEPLIRLWGWLSGEVAPQRPSTAPLPKEAIQQPASTSPAHTDDGSAPDPYGG